MPEKPIMHGRDHRVGGTDPIPGLGFTGLNYCYASVTTLSLPTSGTSAYVPITGLVDSGAGIYQTATGTGSQATVEINAEGIYIAWFRLDVHMSTAPAANSGAQAEFHGGYYPMAGGNGSLFFYNGSTYGLSAEHTVLWNLVPSYGNIPTVLNVSAVQTSGTGLTTSNLDGTLFVAQINPTGNTGF